MSEDSPVCTELFINVRVLLSMQSSPGSPQCEPEQAELSLFNASPD